MSGCADWPAPVSKQLLDDAHLIVEAERSLGRPLQLNHLPVLVDVLREHWVPVMDDEEQAALCELVKLGLVGDACTQRTR